MKRTIFRLVSVTLVPAMGLSGVPAAAQVAAAPASVSQAAPPMVNRSVPAVRPVPMSPSFSLLPGASEITRARIFEEPLVPAGGTSRLENRELARTLTRYVEARSPEDLDGLQAFLSAHPDSPWRVSLRANMGLVAQETGYFSRALEHYEEAWRVGRSAGDRQVRALAERAASELAGLLAGLGHDVRLAALLEEVEGRAFSGSSDERIRMARMALRAMRDDPGEAFRCGPVALANVVRALGIAGQDEIAHTRATARGTSLAQMKALASQAGADLHMARRLDPTAAFPAPSMIHFKTGHFAALLERDGDRYLIADPVFYQQQWVSADALTAESTGYVLAASMPSGFVPVDDAEGGDVWGRSCPNRPDPTQNCPTNGGGGCGAKGSCPAMADYTFLSLHAALRIVDTPLTYRPPKGPSPNFTLTYNQKESFQPSVFTYFNVGPKWTFDALSYVIDDPSAVGAPHTVKIYLRGGGMEIYPSLPASGQSNPEFRTRARLERTSANPITYVRRLPDGSSETFAQPDGGVSFPRKVFLTAQTDPQGNTLSFVYTDTLQLSAVVDAAGQVSTFTYANETSQTIIGMADPFGRTASLSYDAQGRLASITDAIGLMSSFTYAAGDFIDSMTTPYGTTRFSTGDNGARMWIEAEDPLGGRERAEVFIVHSGVIGPYSLPASEVPPGFESFNRNFDAGLTLFWGKRAMALAPNQVSSAEMTHWLEDPATHRPRGVVRAFKKPLEARIWYAYEGQVLTHGADARLVAEARILEPGNPPLVQKTSYTRNQLGKVCTVTDPMGRVTRYSYSGAGSACTGGSGIDLERIEQQNGAGWDLVRTMSYNSSHQPLTITDGALQTTTYTYNAAGQILTTKTPPRAGFPNEERTTVYTYDDTTGHLMSIVSPGNVRASFTYDAYGRMRTLTNNDDDTTTYDYDPFDRPARTTHPDGTYEQLEYDRLDAHRSRDRLGRWTETFHDALRRPISTIDPAGRVVRRQWCNCGSLDRLVDANGNATSWEYDLQGRVTKETRPPDATGVQRSTWYIYDTRTSRLARRIDAKGQHTEYSYALDDKLMGMSYPSAGLPDPPTPSVKLSYSDLSGVLDPHGRLRRMDDGTGRTEYSYHPYGQLGAGALSSVDGQDPGPGDAITYQYDELGRVVSRTFDGVTSTWLYDQQGRLQSQTDPIGMFHYGYQGNTQRLATLLYPNNQGSIYSYHDRTQDRNLASITHHEPNPNNVLDQFSYTYDDVGNIATWRSESVDSPQTDRVLGYDRADQLVAVTESSSGFGALQLKRYRYAYDPAGNRTAEQIDDDVTGATYNARNQLVSQQAGGPQLFLGFTNEAARVTVQSRPATTTPPPANQFSGNAQVGAAQTDVVVQATDYEQPPKVRTNTYRVTQSGNEGRGFVYDNNGNLIQLTEFSGSTHYEWDAENRLVRVLRNGAPIASYTYDGNGRRRTSTNQAGVMTVHTWDGSDVIHDRVGLLTRRFIRGFRIDQQLASVTESGTVTYFLADHLGSVTRNTNAAGDTTLARTHDAWGHPLQGSSVGGFAFTGREWDPATRLYHYRARYYDPKTGRFISEDPVRSGSNFFLYAANNPVNRVDPFGLKDRKWPVNGCVTNTAGCKCPIPAMDMDNGTLYCVDPGTSTPNKRKNHVDVDFVLVTGTWYKIGVWNFDVNEECGPDGGFSAATAEELADIEGKLKAIGKDPKKPCGESSP